ncbi:sigma 54-interacting transcriptional regulator [bacterium AH-315-K03]|nr:sigma 54-interacting transcriptional regulator [bacterium AH-315-K03]
MADKNWILRKVSFQSDKTNDGRVLGIHCVVRDINETQQTNTKSNLTYDEVHLDQAHEEILGQSLVIRKLLTLVEQVAPTQASVLLSGETGTGKELVARAIHKRSLRAKKLMVTVNCAALPAALIESELFGREKGAFTGALAKQCGRFETANNSTIFLDEIGELPLELQPKLLRVLQEGEFNRLGGIKTHKVDIRVIAATNRDLQSLVETGAFRADLYYRLNSFPIAIAPLRERCSDIPELVWTFVNEYEKTMGKRIESIPESVMQKLTTYPWLGNVRELRNVIERAMILSSGKTLTIDLPTTAAASRSDSQTLSDVQRAHILKVLSDTNWRVRGSDGAASVLDLKPSTLESKMIKLGIKRVKNLHASQANKKYAP